MNLKKILMTSLILGGSVSSAILEVHDGDNFIYTDELFPQLHSSVINKSDSDQDVTVIKRRVLMPDGWDVAFCFKKCLSPRADSTTVTMAPGETLSLDVDYEIDPEITASGTAVTEMTIYPDSDPSESYVRSYGVTYGDKIENPPVFLLVETPSKVVEIGTLNEHKVAVHNNSDEEKEVTITRIEHEVPEDWMVTMCLSNCKPPMIKSDDWTIPANSYKKMKVDITPESEGTATLQFDISEKGGETLNSIMLSYPTQGAVTPISGTNISALKKPLKLTRTGGLYSLAFPAGGSTKMVLYNIKGQKLSVLYDGYVNSDQSISLDLSSFGTGALILKIDQNGSTHAFPIHSLN